MASNTWRLAPALDQLFDEANALWPKRSKASDGTIGDAAHSARVSQHNPDAGKSSPGDPGLPTVDAADITTAGLDKARVIKALISDSRVWYVIHDGVIWSRTYGFKARRYIGSNPHRAHIHVSLNPDEASENSRKVWLKATKPAVKSAIQPLSPKVKPGANNGQVRYLKSCLEKAGYATDLPNDGFYGTGVRNAVAKFHRARPEFSARPGGRDEAIGAKGFLALQREAGVK